VVLSVINFTPLFGSPSVILCVHATFKAFIIILQHAATSNLFELEN